MGGRGKLKKAEKNFRSKRQEGGTTAVGNAKKGGKALVFGPLGGSAGRRIAFTGGEAAGGKAAGWGDWFQTVAKAFTGKRGGKSACKGICAEECLCQTPRVRGGLPLF